MTLNIPENFVGEVMENGDKEKSSSSSTSKESKGSQSSGNSQQNQMSKISSDSDMILNEILGKNGILPNDGQNSARGSLGENSFKMKTLISVASGSSLASTNSSTSSSTGAHTHHFYSPASPSSPKSPSHQQSPGGSPSHRHHHEYITDYVYRNNRMRRKSISEAISLALSQEMMLARSKNSSTTNNTSNNNTNQNDNNEELDAPENQNQPRGRSPSPNVSRPRSRSNSPKPAAITPNEEFIRITGSPKAGRVGTPASPKSMNNMNMNMNIAVGSPKAPSNRSPSSPKPADERASSGPDLGRSPSNKSTNLAAIALFQRKNPTERIVHPKAFFAAKNESKHRESENEWNMETRLLEKFYEIPSNSLGSSFKRFNLLHCICSPCRCVYDFFCSLRCTNFVLTLLMVSISVLLFAFLVIILFWVQNERNVQKFRALLISNALDSLRQRIRNFYTLCASAFSALEKHSGDMTDLELTTDSLYSAMRAFVMTGMPIPFYYFYAGRFNGDYTLFFQNKTGGSDKMSMFWGRTWQPESSESTELQTYDVSMLEDVTKHKDMKLTPGWNLTTEYEADENAIWLQNARTHSGFSWTKTYTSSEDPDVILFTLTKPIINESDPDKAPIGYVAIDGNVPVFAKFLEEIPLGSEFQSYIVETSTGYIISCSKSASIIPSRLDNDSLPYRYTWETTYSADIYYSARYLLDRYKSFEQMPIGVPTHDFYLLAYLIPHYLSYYRMKDGEVDWIIVFDLPYIYLNLEIVLIIPLSIMILMVIFIVAFCCSFFSSILLFWNFNTLKQQAQKVETLDLENKIFKRPKSLFSEIRAVQASFNNMVIMLKEFKPYIPTFLLERVQNKMIREYSRDQALQQQQQMQHEMTDKKFSKRTLKDNSVAPKDLEAKDDKKKRKGSKSSSSGSGDEEEGERSSSGPKEPGEGSMSFLHLKRSAQLTRMKKRAVLSGGFEMGRLAVVHVIISSPRVSLSDLSFDTVKKAKKLHTIALDIITKHVNHLGGFLVHSTLDSFTFMFSSRRQCKEAIVAAWNIMQETRAHFGAINALSRGESFSDNASNASSYVGSFSGCSLKIGVATSFCFYGSLGSKSWRVFSVIGDAMMESKVLARQAKYIFPSQESVVLTTDEIINWAMDRFIFRSLGVWRVQKPGTRNIDSFNRSYDDSDIPEDYFEMIPVYKLEDQRPAKNSPLVEDQNSFRAKAMANRMYDTMDQCWRLLENGDMTNAEFLFRNGIALDPNTNKTDPIFLFLKKMIEVKADCWAILDIGRMIFIDHTNSLKRINNLTESESENVIEIPNAIGRGDGYDNLFPNTAAGPSTSLGNFNPNNYLPPGSNKILPNASGVGLIIPGVSPNAAVMTPVPMGVPNPISYPNPHLGMDSRDSNNENSGSEFNLNANLNMVGNSSFGRIIRDSEPADLENEGPSRAAVGAFGPRKKKSLASSNPFFELQRRIDGS